MDGSTRVVCKNNAVIGVQGVLSCEVTSFQRLKFLSTWLNFYWETDKSLEEMLRKTKQSKLPDLAIFYWLPLVGFEPLHSHSRQHSLPTKLPKQFRLAGPNHPSIQPFSVTPVEFNHHEIPISAGYSVGGCKDITNGGKAT